MCRTASSCMAASSSMASRGVRCRRVLSVTAGVRAPRPTRYAAPMGIVLKSRKQIAKMREAGRIVHAVLEAIEAACVPGARTLELNQIAERILARAGARSAFLGYQPSDEPPYPAV